MKKTYIYMLSILCCLLLYSCNEEWKDELFVKEVSFVRRGLDRDKSGLDTIYAKYDSKGGVIPIKVMVLLSGSTTNDQDVSVTIAVDKDTLNDLNFARFRNRKDLYYKELLPKFYNFESMTTTIPKGSSKGMLNLNLKLEDLDLVDNYILPIKISSASPYGVATRKYYSKSLMPIVPFNDYSGRYSSTGVVYNRDKMDQVPLPVPSRIAKVVNENSVFFYAGSIEEQAQDRANYKIKATFNEDGTVTLTSDNPDIHFSQQAGTYTVEKKMDGVLPYLERTYTILYLEYDYSDITNPQYPFNFKFKGNMTLERKRNILIPEEDQQYIF